MKTKIFLFLALAIMALASCNNNDEIVGEDNSFKEAIKNSKDMLIIGKNSLIMNISPENVPLKSGVLKLTIKNNLQPVEFGTDFILAYFNKTKWEPLTLKVYFEDILLHLNTNEEREMGIFLYPELHNFKPGKYKIVKQFYISEFGIAYLSAEFNMQ